MLCDGKDERLFPIYLPEVRHLYIHKEISLAPVLLGTQPPRRRRVLSYLCVAEIYDPTNSNRNAAYLQHHETKLDKGASVFLWDGGSYGSVKSMYSEISGHVACPCPTEYF